VFPKQNASSHDSQLTLVVVVSSLGSITESPQANQTEKNPLWRKNLPTRLRRIHASVLKRVSAENLNREATLQ